MEKMAHDEKTLKSQILYLMQGEKEAVSFGTLLSLLDMSELERAWLHILLLDLCRDGYLKLPERPCSSLDDVMFLPGERKITGDVFETVSGAAENESAAVQSDSGTSEEDAGKTEHDHACGDVLPPADSGTDIPAESDALAQIEFSQDPFGIFLHFCVLTGRTCRNINESLKHVIHIGDTL